MHGLADERFTWFAERGSKLEAITGDLNYDDTWEYSHFVRHGDAQDKKLHTSATAAFRGGWNVGLGVYWETFGWDSTLYAGYRILAPSGATLPFTGIGRIYRDYAITLVTLQWSAFNANLLYVGGQTELLRVGPANINQTLRSACPRSAFCGTGRRVSGFWRRSDGSLVGCNVIPRLGRYQLTA